MCKERLTIFVGMERGADLFVQVCLEVSMDIQHTYKVAQWGRSFSDEFRIHGSQWHGRV